jgi:hypothetical protein
MYKHRYLPTYAHCGQGRSQLHQVAYIKTCINANLAKFPCSTGGVVVNVDRPSEVEHNYVASHCLREAPHIFQSTGLCQHTSIQRRNHR